MEDPRVRQEAQCGPAGMTMRWMPFRIAVGVALIAALAAAPVLGGAVSSGGPWSYTSGGITIKYSGAHGALLNQAYSDTYDYNGSCDGLAGRLKYNPGSVDSGWIYDESGANTIRLLAPVGTTAVSSQHRAQNPLNGFWSPAAQPHAW